MSSRTTSQRYECIRYDSPAFIRHTQAAAWQAHEAEVAQVRCCQKQTCPPACGLSPDSTRWRD